MLKPNADTVLTVVVSERPNWVTVTYDDQTHSGRWRTAGENGKFSQVTGNKGLLNAAMLAWCGEQSFQLSFEELEARSQGWGGWWDED
jgi:hypothetical protein